MARKSFSEDMQSEIARQIQAQFVRSGFGRELYQLYHWTTSGAIFNPRNLIALMVALGGLLFVGCAGILGTIAAWYGLQG